MIATIIGSRKNDAIIKLFADKIALQGVMVFAPYFGNAKDLSDDDMLVLRQTIKEKILHSHIVYVVGDYVGLDTENEIEFCKNFGKPYVMVSDRYVLKGE